MGRKSSQALTDAELTLMNVLWSKGRATVSDVLEAIEGPKPSYNSIQTRLNILEEKGYARRRQVGRAFVYLPRIAQEAAASSALSHLIRGFFGSTESLALRLIESDQLTSDELANLESKIGKKRGKR